MWGATDPQEGPCGCRSTSGGGLWHALAQRSKLLQRPEGRGADAACLQKGGEPGRITIACLRGRKCRGKDRVRTAAPCGQAETRQCRAWRLLYRF